ncbi:RDD family protein [Cellulomonas soli]|uniref:RDD family protein n=1 Tax=Cellulomonas soli TaxID=931535 RepID=UPI003F87E453
MERREGAGSWLEGGPGGAQEASARGRRLGLPAEGPGSPARLGRRVIALGIDWAASLAVSAALFDGDPMATLGVFAVENLVLVGTLGHTLGHRLLGLRVRRVVLPAPGAAVPAQASPVTGGTDPLVAPGLVAAFVRTALLCLVVPAVVWDADGRGLHDRAAGTAIVRR